MMDKNTEVAHLKSSDLKMERANKFCLPVQSVKKGAELEQRALWKDRTVQGVGTPSTYTAPENLRKIPRHDDLDAYTMEWGFPHFWIRMRTKTEDTFCRIQQWEV